MPPKPITKDELDDNDGNESLGGDSQSREFIDPNNTGRYARLKASITNYRVEICIGAIDYVQF